MRSVRMQHPVLPEDQSFLGHFNSEKQPYFQLRCRVSDKGFLDITFHVYLNFRVSKEVSLLVCFSALALLAPIKQFMLLLLTFLPLIQILPLFREMPDSSSSVRAPPLQPINTPNLLSLVAFIRSLLLCRSRSL